MAAEQEPPLITIGLCLEFEGEQFLLERPRNQITQPLQADELELLKGREVAELEEKVPVWQARVVPLVTGGVVGAVCYGFSDTAQQYLSRESTAIGFGVGAAAFTGFHYLIENRRIDRRNRLTERRIKLLESMAGLELTTEAPQE